MNRWGENLHFKTLMVPLLLLPLLLGGCSVPNWADPTEWFGDDEAGIPDSNVDENAQIPNLAQVPSEPRVASSSEVRAQTAAGLAADRANAQYSDETLVAGGSLAQPQVPAAPSQSGQLTGAVPASPSVPTVPSTVQSPSAVQPQVAAVPSTAPPAPTYSPPRQSVLAAVIFFGHGSAALDASDREVLRGVIASQRQRGAEIMVVGHASSRTGNASPAQHQVANFNISVKRANAIASALAKLGAPPGSVRTEARADAQPVYHEFMPTGESGNRRAEIFLIF